MNLNSKTVRGILPLLALRPGEGHTLTELARFSGLDTKSVWQALASMRAEGALLDGAHGQKTYSFNLDYAHAIEMRVIALRYLDLPQALADVGAPVDLVLVHGSMFRPVFRPASDIDLVVVGRDDRAVRAAVFAVSERLGKRFSVTFYTPSQFITRWTDRDAFLTTVFSGPHSVLTGSLDRLGLGADA